MNVEHPPDDDSLAKARANRAAAKLRVYKLERLAYTDAANVARSDRKSSGRRWQQCFMALLHLIK